MEVASRLLPCDAADLAVARLTRMARDMQLLVGEVVAMESDHDLRDLLGGTEATG